MCIDLCGLVCFVYRRLPHVSLKESPKEAKPSRYLDLSDTDSECDTAPSVSVAVKAFFRDFVFYFCNIHTRVTVKWLS